MRYNLLIYFRNPTRGFRRSNQGRIKGG